MDIIHRLNALAAHEHDDASIGYEAAEIIIDLRVQVDALQAELAALRKDADRYRWLRDAENGGEFSVGQQCSVCDEYPKYEEVAWYYDIELDVLIDAAMQRTKAVGAG